MRLSSLDGGPHRDDAEHRRSERFLAPVGRQGITGFVGVGLDLRGRHAEVRHLEARAHHVC
jgi:hypothetical protein